MVPQVVVGLALRFAELDACRDPRIRQFIEGRAGGRLTELQEEQGLTDGQKAGEEGGP